MYMCTKICTCNYAYIDACRCRCMHIRSYAPLSTFTGMRPKRMNYSNIYTHIYKYIWA